ncbi:MAG TPA: hypothetical protein EYP10_08625 [Armatimonadetes bacterium]|nr:hypothetical protein [Armatimonadota bacterium]
MFKPIRFIAEPVEAHFERPPSLEKKLGCPDAFVWREETYRIIEKLAEWHDYRRRGRMAVNMRPHRAQAAARWGSGGVGRDYFRVRVEGGQVFDLYYDRAPQDVDRRKGGWFLYRELEAG